MGYKLVICGYGGSGRGKLLATELLKQMLDVKVEVPKDNLEKNIEKLNDSIDKYEVGTLNIYKIKGKNKNWEKKNFYD